MTVSQKDYVWISELFAIAIHDRQLAEHGGPSGTRDNTLLQSALSKPQSLKAYGEPDLSELAASYAFGIARNHPFVDGNKRTAFVVCETFLALNGVELTASDVDCVLAMQDLAAGEITEAEFATWVRNNSKPS